jgi:hypothetical protein
MVGLPTGPILHLLRSLETVSVMAGVVVVMVLSMVMVQCRYGGLRRRAPCVGGSVLSHVWGYPVLVARPVPSIVLTHSLSCVLVDVLY